MRELLENEYVVRVAMAVVSFLVTQILKWILVKPYTKNLNKRAKTIVNSIILIIAFGVAIGCEYLYSHFWLHSAIDLNRVIDGFTGATSVYAFFEVFAKIIKGEDVKIENPYTTEEGKAVVELVTNITADGKIDKNDKSAIQEYFDALNK